MPSSLRASDHGQRFRQELREQSGLQQQLKSDTRSTSRQTHHLREFVAYSLCADCRRLKPPRLVDYAPPRLACDLEVETGGKTDGAQHSERIVVKSDLRIERRANNACLQIVKSPPRQIEQLARVQVFQQRVQREIAAKDVFSQTGLSNLRLARVRRIAFRPRRHQFDRRIAAVRQAQMHHGRAEARIDHGIVRSRAALKKMNRQSRRVSFQHEIEIVGKRQPQQAIPKEPADKVQFAFVLRIARQFS